MATAAQVLANRENGKKSHGPVTEEGKLASCLNNFRHGLTGHGFYLLPNEDPKLYDALLADLKAEHNPQTATEKILVQKMGQSHWLAQRAVRLQTIVSCCAQNSLATDELTKLARYQNQHERAFQQSLNQLLKLRAERRKEQIGFESQKRAEAAGAQREQQQQARARQDHLKTEILEQKREREKSNALTAAMKASAAMERHLGPEGMKMLGQMAA
jgi:low affinity Fe/Cu permease